MPGTPTALACGKQLRSKSAINQLEMWQEATSIRSDRYRVHLAEAMGMNTMRVFFMTCSGNRTRPDSRSASIGSDHCIRHHIRPIFVIFDSCWIHRHTWARSILRFQASTIQAGSRVRARRRLAIPSNIRVLRRT